MLPQMNTTVLPFRVLAPWLLSFMVGSLPVGAALAQPGAEWREAIVTLQDGSIVSAELKVPERTRTPQLLTYRSPGSGEPVEVGPEAVAAVEIAGEIRLISASVALEASPDRPIAAGTARLDTARRLVFLETLAEGAAASLYRVATTANTRYYLAADGATPSLLAYKQYREAAGEGPYSEVTAYRSQVGRALGTCPAVSPQFVGSLAYKARALREAVVRANACAAAETQTYVRGPTRAERLRIGVFAGVSYVGYQTDYNSFGLGPYGFSYVATPVVGIAVRQSLRTKLRGLSVSAGIAYSSVSGVGRRDRDVPDPRSFDFPRDTLYLTDEIYVEGVPVLNVNLGLEQALPLGRRFSVFGGAGVVLTSVLSGSLYGDDASYLRTYPRGDDPEDYAKEPIGSGRGQVDEAQLGAAPYATAGLRFADRVDLAWRYAARRIIANQVNGGTRLRNADVLLTYFLR